jgi:hypothetical protein
LIDEGWPRWLHTAATQPRLADKHFASLADDGNVAIREITGAKRRHAIPVIISTKSETAHGEAKVARLMCGVASLLFVVSECLLGGGLV